MARSPMDTFAASSSLAVGGIRMDERLPFEWVCLMPECMAAGQPLRMRYASLAVAEVEYIKHKIAKHGLQARPGWDKK